MNTRELIAKRVAQELEDGMVVNLGVGIPTMVPSFVSSDKHITLHSENGLIGMGKPATEETKTDEVVDPAGRWIESEPYAAFVDSTMSFTIVRGGHLDLTVLGALEVAENGDIANWMVPGKKINGMGGGMDLLVGAKKVIVAMEHKSKAGNPKILDKCTMPLSAKGQVNMIITDMAVIDVVPGKGLVLKEIASGLTVEDVQAATGAKLHIEGEVKTINV
jgi:acetate CoA/acetoacetate CoA-transferase beta subunit